MLITATILPIVILLIGAWGAYMTFWPPNEKKIKIVVFLVFLFLLGAEIYLQSSKDQASEKDTRATLNGDEKNPPHLDFITLSNGTDVARAIVSNGSPKYSAYGVEITLTDTGTGRVYPPIQFPEIVPSTARPVFDLDLSGRDSAKMIAVIRNRSGTFKQQIAFHRDADGWNRAWRLVNDKGVVLTYEPADFPSNAKGQIDWPQ